MNSTNLNIKNIVNNVDMLDDGTSINNYYREYYGTNNVSLENILEMSNNSRTYCPEHKSTQISKFSLNV